MRVWCNGCWCNIAKAFVSASDVCVCVGTFYSAHTITIDKGDCTKMQGMWQLMYRTCTPLNYLDFQEIYSMMLHVC